MFRYFSMIWDPADAVAEVAARAAGRRLLDSSEDWSCSLDGTGMAVYCTGTRPGTSGICLLSNGTGVILGTVFRSNGAASPNPIFGHLAASESSSIVRTHGRELLSNYWGRYVAILRPLDGTCIYAIRDPSGALPCYVISEAGVTAIVSDVQDYVRVSGRKLTINWKQINALLCHPTLTLRSGSTGLNEVQELPAGSCLQFSSGLSATVSYWDPVAVARAHPIDNVDMAVDAVRSACEKVVWGWASCYPRIIHLLSGGLDSSIIASCLKSAPSQPGVTCLNYYDSDAESDERCYARMAAEAAGYPLVECEDKPSEVQLESIFNISRSASPWSYLYFVEHSRKQGELAANRGASGIFAGAGGDQVFFQRPLLLAPADYLYRHGPRRDFFRIAWDTARMSGVAIWTVIALALKHRISNRAASPMQDIGQNSKLVTGEALAEFVRCVGREPPPIALATDLPPGKRSHALAVGCGHDFYDPLGSADYPERVRPLVSQPLIETCLRIPTYVLTHGGWDRAIARLAFQRELPAPIAVRRAKGRIDTYLSSLLRLNLNLIRELLLDGLLVRAGLLNRVALEKALAESRSNLLPEAGEIVCQHVSTEVWARGWSN